MDKISEILGFKYTIQVGTGTYGLCEEDGSTCNGMIATIQKKVKEN